MSTGAIAVQRYSEAIEVQLDLAAYYGSPAGRRVADGWATLYERVEPIDVGHRWDLSAPFLHSTPVYLEGRIASMLDDAASTFPDDYELHPADLPFPHGCLTIGGPTLELMTKTPLGYRQDLRGVLWTAGSEGVAVHAFGPSYNLNDPTEADNLNQIHIVDLWRWGQRVGDRSPAAVAIEKGWEELELIRRAVPEKVTDLQHPTPADVASIDYRSHRLRQIAFAVWSFMNQKVAVTSARRVDRATRRRVEKARPGHEPVVQVIELRAHAYENLGNVEEAARSPYTVRFVVRGHWRNQWYPGEGRHKPLWIEPYIKGPDGAPVKGGTKLFAVTR